MELIFVFNLSGQLEIGAEESEDTDVVVKKDEGETDPAASAAQPTQPVHTGSTTNVHPLLSSIVNYTHPTKFQVKPQLIKFNIGCLLILGKFTTRE